MIRRLLIALALLLPIAGVVPIAAPSPAVAQSVGPPTQKPVWPKYRVVNGNLYQYYQNGWSNVYVAGYLGWIWIDVVRTPFPY